LGELPLRRVGDYRQTSEFLVGKSITEASESYAARKIAARRWGAGAHTNFKRAIRQVVQVIGDKPASTMTKADVETVFVTLSGQGFTPQYLELVRTYFCQFARWLTKHDVLAVDISTIWERQRWDEDEHTRVYHHFTREEVEVVASAAKPALALYIWTSVYTGMRRANTAGLRWSWIDVTPAGWVIEIPSKKFKQRRRHRIPVHPALAQMWGCKGGPDEKIIKGLPHHNSLGRRLKRLSKKTGIPREWLYPHNLRRTCAFWLKKAGATREEAMAFFGTKSMTTLIRHYWPPDNDQEKWGIVGKLGGMPGPCAQTGAQPSAAGAAGTSGQPETAKDPPAVARTAEATADMLRPPSQRPLPTSLLAIGME